MSKRRRWGVSALPFKHGRMICSCCDEPIEEGQYRYRLDSTRDAYIVQHRKCTPDAQEWVYADFMVAQAKQIIRNKLADFESFLTNWPDEREVRIRVIELRKQIEYFDGETDAHV